MTFRSYQLCQYQIHPRISLAKTNEFDPRKSSNHPLTYLLTIDHSDCILSGYLTFPRHFQCPVVIIGCINWAFKNGKHRISGGSFFIKNVTKWWDVLISPIGQWDRVHSLWGDYLRPISIKYFGRNLRKQWEGSCDDLVSGWVHCSMHLYYYCLLVEICINIGNSSRNRGKFMRGLLHFLLLPCEWNCFLWHTDFWCSNFPIEVRYNHVTSVKVDWISTTPTMHGTQLRYRAMTPYGSVVSVSIDINFQRNSEHSGTFTSARGWFPVNIFSFRGVVTLFSVVSERNHDRASCLL